MIQVLVCRVGQRPNIELLDTTLEAMQAVVDGYIQILVLTDGVALVCNEEGRLRGMPLNCLVPARGIDIDLMTQAIGLDPKTVFVMQMGDPDGQPCLHGELGCHEVHGDFFVCRTEDPGEVYEEGVTEDEGWRNLTDADIERWTPLLNACRVHREGR